MGFPSEIFLLIFGRTRFSLSAFGFCFVRRGQEQTGWSLSYWVFGAGAL